MPFSLFYLLTSIYIINNANLIEMKLLHLAEDLKNLRKNFFS